jgi:transposase
MSRALVGAAVRQDSLDAHARPAGLHQRFDNAPEGIEQLVAWVRALAPQRAAFESTGPYQKAAAGALLAAGLPAYAGLKARGKATGVALIAVARKLLVLADALPRGGAPYQARANSVCPKNA